MNPEEQVQTELQLFTRQDRMKLAGVILGGVVILSLLVIFTLGFWVWYALFLVLCGAAAYLYIYHPDKFIQYSPKLLQLTDETSTTIQNTSTKVKDTVHTVSVKTLDISTVAIGKAKDEFQSRIASMSTPTGGEIMTLPTQPTPMIMPDATNPDEIARQVIRISVPKNTKWDAEKAKRFMDKLFAVENPLVLSIRATEHQITWFIEVAIKGKIPVINAIQADYPQATIEVTPKTNLDLGYYRYQIEVDTPSFAPYKDVLKLRSHDPLTGIVTAMKNMSPGEELVYELVLYYSTYNYTELAEQFLVKPLEVGWFNLLNDDVRAEVLARQAMGTNKIEVYTEEISSAIRTKANSLCLSARFSLKVKASSAVRADTVYGDFVSALEVFDNVPTNLLVGAKETGTYPLLLTSAEAAAIWHLPSSDIQTMGVDWSRGVVAPLPNELVALSRNSARESILLGTNTYQGRTYDVRLTYYDRVPHVNIIGRSRVGKSTLLHNMIHQDIQNGKGVGVIDPHGTLVRDILKSSIPSEKINDVILFDVKDKDYPIGMNLLSPESNISPEAHSAFVVAVLRKIFEDVWSTGRTEDVVSACINTLIVYPGATIYDVPRLLLDDEFRTRIVKNVKDPVTRDFWKFEYDKKSESGKMQFAQPVNNKLRRLFRDPDLRRILCQSRSLNFRQIIDTNKIFLASLGGMAEAEAETLGTLIMAKIQMAAMSRGENPGSVFYFYVDEVQKFITTSLSVILSEAAKFGLSMVIANQFLKQLEGDTLDAVLGNVGSTIIFRVGVRDAALLASSVRPNVTADDLENLDRFNNVVKMQLNGQTLPAFSMMTLPPLPTKDEADATIEDIQNRSRTAYGTHRDDVDREIDERYNDEDDTSGDDSDDTNGNDGKFLG